MFTLHARVKLLSTGTRAAGGEVPPIRCSVKRTRKMEVEQFDEDKLGLEISRSSRIGILIYFRYFSKDYRKLEI